MIHAPFAICDACGAAKLKLCSACGTRLPRSRFHLDVTRADRLNTRCDTCTSIKNHIERKRAGQTATRKRRASPQSGTTLQ